jgi:hypothetical protein
MSLHRRRRRIPDGTKNLNSKNTGSQPPHLVPGEIFPGDLISLTTRHQKNLRNLQKIALPQKTNERFQRFFTSESSFFPPGQLRNEAIPGKNSEALQAERRIT